MKIHVKNINVEPEILWALLCQLRRVFATNKDTHTFDDCDEWLETELNSIKKELESLGKTILITKGGL